MRTRTKSIVVGIALLIMFLLPSIGDAYRYAAEARRIVAEESKARLVVADALKKAAAEQPSNQVFASYALFRQDEPVAENATPDHAKDRQELIERRKDMCIAAMIQGEAGNQPVTGKYMAGYVGHMRAVDKWFGSDNPCVQVCKRGNGTHREFDGTKQFCAQIETAFKKGGRLPSVPEPYIKMAHEIRTGVFQPEEKCRGVRFFANFAESSPGGIKDFQKNTKIRCIEGDHLFAESRPIRNKMIANAQHQRSHKKHLPVVAAGKYKHTLQRVAHR